MRTCLRSGLFLLGTLSLVGCGSVQEVILDAVQTSAKESIEQAVDGAVNGVVDDLMNFGGLVDDEGQSND